MLMSARARPTSVSTDRSPSETTPTARPPSTTGSRRTFKPLISSRVSRTVSGIDRHDFAANDILHLGRVGVTALRNGADSDIPVRDDAHEKFRLRFRDEHVADVIVGHHPRRRGKRVSGVMVRGDGVITSRIGRTSTSGSEVDPTNGIRSETRDFTVPRSRLIDSLSLFAPSA